jgi:hypothetical protein
MKKIITTIVLGLLISGGFYAQEEEIKDSIKVRKNAIGFSIGLPGFGFDYARKISNKLSAKIRFNTFSINDYTIEDIDIKGNIVDATISGDVKTIDLLVEFLPFKNSSFKLVGGLGIINKLYGNTFIVYDNTITFGDVVLTKEDYGNIDLGFNWASSVSPYLGLGFGRAIPNSRFGFGIEAGSYFASSPDITLEASKLLAPTGDQLEKINETFKTWKYIPLIQFRLVYAF